jgi:hypothetical protein
MPVAIEEVARRRVDAKLDLHAGAQCRVAGQLCNERRFQSTDVDQCLTTQALDQRHLALKTFAERRGRHDIEVFGPDADRDGIARRDLRARPRDLERAAARGDGDPPACDCRDVPRKEIHARRADEAGDEQVRRPRIQLERRPDLLDAPGIQHHDARSQCHRLHLIVGHIHHRRSEPRVQPSDLDAHLAAQRRVEIRERLIEQEHVRLAHDRAPDRHALPLTA